MDAFLGRYGPWAVVTGASSGIGEEFARQLAARGFSLVVCARRKDRLDALADALRAKHAVSIVTVELDLARDDLVERLDGHVRGLDVGLLVNNAGFGEKGPFLESSVDDDLRMLIVSLHQDVFEVYHLESVVSNSGHEPATATVRLKRGEQRFTESANGDGPIDAACKAIERISGVKGCLEQFEIRATTPGQDAMGEAYVTVGVGAKTYKGNGASTDIIEAAVKAYLNAVNKHLALAGGTRIHPQKDMPAAGNA